MRLPTINMNGSGGLELIEQYGHARTALIAALRALEAASPNGRDYPQGFDAVREATDEARERHARVRASLVEIEMIFRSLHEQMAARAARRAR